MGKGPRRAHASARGRDREAILFSPALLPHFSHSGSASRDSGPTDEAVTTPGRLPGVSRPFDLEIHCLEEQTAEARCPVEGRRGACDRCPQQKKMEDGSSEKRTITVNRKQ